MTRVIEKYITHYRNSKFYVRHGMLVEKVHNRVSFKQKQKLKPYIIFNTERRAAAKNEVAKNDLPKFMVFSFFGKSMEIVRERINIDVFEKTAKEHDWPSLSKHFDQLHDSNVEYNSHIMEQDEIEKIKQFCIGYTILKLEQLLINETYYDVLETNFVQKEQNNRLHGYK